MKKFLIFLVSIVVVVCIGLTTFYFLKNDEIITISTKELYVNAGDTISLESLGIVRKKAHRKTTFNYNAGGEAVTSAIRYDEALGYYVVDGNTAGEITLVITTSNEKYAEFTIKVHVGNGEAETPYYVFNQTDLTKIGSSYALDDHYKLMNDITLTSSYQPVGYFEEGANWIGFSGNFNGNGHTISGLTLNSDDYASAGLFSSINTGAEVYNLNIKNVNIDGSYTKAGALAGEILGTVERVSVENVTITNSANNSYTGVLAGSYKNGSVKMVYADNATINVGKESAVTNATVGGLFGEFNQATAQATYVNNTTIAVVDGSTGNIGGWAGSYTINTDKGSIQQSYANVISEYTNMGAFIGSIVKASGFAGTENTVTRYLIGNVAVLNNSTNVVKTYDTTYFTYFYNEGNSSYLITEYAQAPEMILNSSNLVFYAIDSANKTYWDTDYVWAVSTTALPTLRMGSIEPTSPSGEYFRKSLDEIEVSDTAVDFKTTFANDQSNKKFSIKNDVTLSSWTPVALTNCTIDGNNKTITVNLSGSKDDNVGLFSIIDNCTIKNLNIVVTGISGAENVGALAGKITSSDSVASSTVENVNVTYNTAVGAIVATNFGGIVGVSENTDMSTVVISGLNSSANAINAGAIVADLVSGKVAYSTISNVTVCGNEKVGVVAAKNAGTISNVTTTSANAKFSTAVEAAKIGGVVAVNEGTITNVTANVNVSVNNANTTVYAGGVAAQNNNEISGVKLTGSGIAVTDTSAAVYIGGVVALNNKSITNVQNNTTSVGTFATGKNYYVGGVAYRNAGSISKVVAGSNVYGNTVAGVVVDMNTSSATVDQVYVGNYVSKTANEIKADKYIAGVVFDFRSGSITNIQANSSLIGAANSTRTSLVALIFPYGAKMKNATISSSMTGYGKFYRETWTDFATDENHGGFGFSFGETGDSRFNVYTNDTQHGSMQSVVIDSSKAGVSSAKAAMGAAFAFSKDYTDSSESSYIKVVNGFSNISQFEGSFSFKCAESTMLGINHNVSKTLTFDTEDIWTNNGAGISLKFLSSLA